MSAVRKLSGDVSPRRRAMLAKLQIAKKQLNMVEDDYRQLLLDHAGSMSAREASDRGLECALKRMTDLGFKAMPTKPQRQNAATRKLADHASARKARALWLSLWQLGAVHNASEEALESFAKRQLKCDRLQWADQSMMYRLIEALKAMAQRHGWDQSMEGVTPTFRAQELKKRLAIAILGKLKTADIVPEGWSLADTMLRMFGEELKQTPESLELAAVTLGQKLRENS